MTDAVEGVAELPVFGRPTLRSLARAVIFTTAYLSLFWWCGTALLVRLMGAGALPAGGILTAAGTLLGVSAGVISAACLFVRRPSGLAGGATAIVACVLGAIVQVIVACVMGGSQAFIPAVLVSGVEAFVAVGPTVIGGLCAVLVERLIERAILARRAAVSV